MFEFERTHKGAVIKVVGVGGAGGNAVANMMQSGIEGVEFIVANTDAQALNRNDAPNKIHLGQLITKGLGAGGNPEIGQKAAIEDMELISDSLKGSDIVFVTAGMGGGTGTGAAPVIASAARDLGALTVAVVSTPFSWEGRRRNEFAEKGLANLKEHVDSFIVVQNDRLLEVVEKNTSMSDGFRLADDVLRQGVQGISDTINVPGLINLDCADVRACMSNQGMALMGMGTASGDNREREALERALKGPLLADANIRGAYGILLNITGDVTLHEVANVGSMINEYAGQEASIYVGAVNDGRTDGSLKVVVVATGINQQSKPATFETFIPKKKEPANELEMRIKAIQQADKRLPGIDDYNDEEFIIPTYLRKQMD